MQLVKKLVFLTLLLTQLGIAQKYTGRVIGIADGDTFSLLTVERELYKIRLRHIDTPEKKQPFANRAKQALSNLIYHKQIIADCHGKSWSRHICDVTTADGIDVQAEMIKQGAAWVFPKYNRRDDLPPLQAEAQQENRGLWALPEVEQMPPWQWREKRKKQNSLDN